MPTAPRLHVVYRSHGGDNRKQRPDFYGKPLALASFLRAAGQCGEPGHGPGLSPEILFLNDGPIPADRLDVMRRHGEIVPVDGGSNRRSYRAAVALAARRPWPDDDVVWFAEDDYLYGVESLAQVRGAAAALPTADYFSMWGDRALDPASTSSHPRAREQPRSLGATEALPLDGVRWYRGISTTSTFGVRAGVLREDARLLRQLPFSGGAWDHTTCLAVQGLQPFPWRTVRRRLAPFGAATPVEWPRSVGLGLSHAAVNLRSRRRPGSRRTLYASDPELIFHMELPTEADGRDWPAFAAQTRSWALDQGLPLDGPVDEPAGEPASREVGRALP